MTDTSAARTWNYQGRVIAFDEQRARFYSTGSDGRTVYSTSLAGAKKKIDEANTFVGFDAYDEITDYGSEAKRLVTEHPERVVDQIATAGRYPRTIYLIKVSVTGYDRKEKDFITADSKRLNSVLPATQETATNWRAMWEAKNAREAAVEKLDAAIHEAQRRLVHTYAKDYGSK